MMAGGNTKLEPGKVYKHRISDGELDKVVYLGKGTNWSGNNKLGQAHKFAHWEQLSGDKYIELFSSEEDPCLLSGKDPSFVDGLIEIPGEHRAMAIEKSGDLAERMLYEGLAKLLGDDK